MSAKSKLARKGIKAGLKAGKKVGKKLASGFGKSKSTASGAVKPGGGLAGVGRPLAFGAAATGSLVAGGFAVEKIGRAKNPPLQREGIDTDGDGKDDTVVLFDPRTGGQTGFGKDPTFQGDPERSDERTREQLIFAGIVGLVALAAVAVFRGR